MADYASVDPRMLAQMIMMRENPAAAMQLQQQQMLAQQLMEQGANYPNPLETAQGGPLVGGRAIKTSPITDAAHAVEQVLGGYMMKKNNERLAELLAPTTQGNGGGGSYVPGTNPAAPLTGNEYQDAIENQINPSAYKAQVDVLAERAKPQMVNGVLTTPNAQLPPAGVAPLSPRPVMTTRPVGPAAPAAGASDAVNSIPPIPSAPVNPMQAQFTPAPAGAEAPTAVRPTSAGVNPNDPAAMEAAKAEAGKAGENLADAQKTYTVAASNLPRALQRFDELRNASKDASYGVGIDEEGEGVKQKFAQQLEPKVATANQIISQASKQGVLAELGPQLAGLRGNKFLESIASGASGLNAADPPKTKINAVNGLQRQYIANLKSLAGQRRAYGDPNAPTDEQIDAMVAQHAKIPQSAIAHLQANPETADQFEQQFAVPAGGFIGAQ